MVLYNLADEEETDVIGEQVKAAAALSGQGVPLCAQRSVGVYCVGQWLCSCYEAPGGSLSFRLVTLKAL